LTHVVDLQSSVERCVWKQETRFDAFAIARDCPEKKEIKK
jgi:hypothetical protein